MARPKSLQFDDIRATILAAAARLFAAQGFRNTNIIDIGEACGASKSRMYHYFASKDAMLADMLVRHVATLVAQAEPIVQGPEPARERLRAYLLLHLRHYYEARDCHTVLVEDADHLPPPARAEVRRLEQQLVGLLQQLLHEIDPRRFADRTSAGTHAMLIYGMLNWTYTWYRPSGRLSLDALADQATQLCLHGVDPLPQGAARSVTPPRRTLARPTTRRPRTLP